ncbi:A11 Protein [Finch poxvirus]|uniref:A11 protein n=2 Tax=unclassified Avipoxvirus TaxID=336487 RepID=A0AAT9UQ05_9POXV|nr:A11 Protein [Finch poxvirus]UOX39011.1 A11 Protein [Finch poxvirus]
MAELLVTDIANIANEYSLTTFSEDKYPNNKNYDITTGQLTALKTVKVILTAKTGEKDDYEKESLQEDDENDRCMVSEVDTVISYNKDHDHGDNDNKNYIQSSNMQTPSLSVTYDENKRLHLLEEEIASLKKKSKSKNLIDFTTILFKNPDSKILNKRATILSYASMNNSALTMEDLEACEDSEIDSMYEAVKSYNEINKKKIIVTNVISILISVLEQILVKLGFEEIRGLSKDINSSMIIMEIGTDCEIIATKMGIGNNPVLNICLFILRIFISRINII